MSDEKDLAPCKISIAGLGTVGIGTVKVLQAHGEKIATTTGRPIEIIAVCARDQSRDRGVDLSAYAWYEDAAQMAEESDADIFVEMIGGSEGIAKTAVEIALKKGRHVVTANKALMAIHGLELARIAEDNNVTIAYEAAVAGGIPVIKTIREGLVANNISSFHGILNGTCNYILTTMRETGRRFDDVLSEAQALGYAEADPSFDVDGVDAAHKLALLTSLAFGTKVDFDSLHIEGIRNISPVDVEFAEELGYRIKLLGIADKQDNGIHQRVYPAMVPKTCPITNVEGVFNAVVTEGDFVGTTVMEGRGAGEGPTASAVVADIIDIAAGRISPVFGIKVEELRDAVALPMDSHAGDYYVRLKVVDEPGVIAKITAVLRDENISMRSIIQRSRYEDGLVNLVVTTHKASEKAMMSALSIISELDAVRDEPDVLRIEYFGHANNGKLR